MNNCPEYSKYSRIFHEPGSGGLLNLPFQRPIEACRRFSSRVIETVIQNVTSKIQNIDLSRLFLNSFPNTLDTAIAKTVCLNRQDQCLPLSFIITGDIDAMWLRDSANQILPYIDYIHHDLKLKRLFLGVIYMQAHFINIDPYSNAFKEPQDLFQLSKSLYLNETTYQKRNNSMHLIDGVFENKWEIDSLASFMSLSYQYWNRTGDDSFVNNSIWVNAIQSILDVVHSEQSPTFDPDTGKALDTNYLFFQTADRPTETQFLSGRGQPVKQTGMVKSLFRPSDDATVFPFFIPGNAMLSVEFEHISELLKTSKYNKDDKIQSLAEQTHELSIEIRESIYKYGIIQHPVFGEIFAYEVDGYGSSLIMDDANIPSLLSLPLLGFVNQNDTIYQNTRKLILSNHNPYYFSGSRGSGIGGPHVGLGFAWPMSQIVKILTSNEDKEIKEALDILLYSTDNTGLIHESFNVFEKTGGDDNLGYTRSWFSWANGLFAQSILKLISERPHLITSQ